MKINKKVITVDPLFENYKKTIHLFINTVQVSEVVLVFERDSAGLKKLSSFV
jgi:hypothetical protein